MTIEDIFKLSKEEFENLDLKLLNLDLAKDAPKIRLLTQWYFTYNRQTTSNSMRQAILESASRLLCPPLQ